VAVPSRKRQLARPGGGQCRHLRQRQRTHLDREPRLPVASRQLGRRQRLGRRQTQGIDRRPLAGRAVAERDLDPRPGLAQAAQAAELPHRSQGHRLQQRSPGQQHGQLVRQPLQGAGRVGQRQTAEAQVGETTAARFARRAPGHLAQVVGVGVDAEHEARRIGGRPAAGVGPVTGSEVDGDGPEGRRQLRQGSAVHPVFFATDDEVHRSSLRRGTPPGYGRRSIVAVKSASRRRSPTAPWCRSSLPGPPWPGARGSRPRPPPAPSGRRTPSIS
jgi:hypothetical protein